MKSSNKAQEAILTTVMKDVYGETDKEVEVIVTANATGLSIAFKGYGTAVSDESICIEVARNELVLYAWTDPEQEDHTHRISLESANEDNLLI